MKIKSTQDLAKFAYDQYRISGFCQHSLAEMLGLKQPAVSKALNPKSFGNPASNKTRLAILDRLGFKVESCFNVTKKVGK